MTKKLAIIIHKYNDSINWVKSKTDLADLLGVSLSTVIRNYSNVGRYDTDVYIIYIGVEAYQNAKEKSYRHDVTPPTVIRGDEIKRHNNANNHVIMTTKDQLVIQIKTDNNDEYGPNGEYLPEDKYDSYYSSLSLEQLTSHLMYWRLHPKRVAVIKHYGELRQLD
jgi:hypothetical protein